MVQVEGWCCSPIIRQQRCFRRVTEDTPYQKHTLGQGRASVAIPQAKGRATLLQGVGLVPSSSRECDTRRHLRAAAKTTPTCDEAAL